jgi:uncharacterized protein YecT (DUF1311 family)
MKYAIPLGLIVAALGVWATPAGAQTQMDYNQMAHDEAMATDATLNKSYQRLMSRLHGHAHDLLVNSELKWIVFRDAECDFEEDKYRGGSIQPLEYWHTYNRLSKTRMKQLEASTPGQTSPAADATLNTLYQELVKSQDQAGAKLLQKAELAWIAFRDAESDFQATRYHAPRAGALAQLTLTRNQELKAELQTEH